MKSNKPKPSREPAAGRAVAVRPMWVLLFAAVLAVPVVPPVSAQSAVSSPSPAGSAASIVQGRSYVVTPKAANVRPRPSTEAAAVAWLRRGTRVRVISGPAGDGDWRRVEREGQPVGYVHVSVLATEADAAARGRAVLRDAFDRLRDARFDEAVDLFEDGLALAPGNGVATFYLGESLFALARFDEAANNYRRVLELAPGTEEERRARLRLRDLDAPNALPPSTAASPRVAADLPPIAAPPTASSSTAPRAAASPPAAPRAASPERDSPLPESRPSAAAPDGAPPGTMVAPAAEPPPVAAVDSSLRLFAAARELAAATAAPGGRFSGLLNVASLQTRAGATPDVAVSLAAAEPVVAEMAEAAEPERRPEIEVVGWGAIAGLQCRAGLREAAAASLEREAAAAGDDLELMARALTTRWQCGLPMAAESIFERIEALDAAVAVQEGEPADERQSLLARRLAIQGAFPWALRVMRRVEDSSWRWLAVNAIVLQLRRHGYFEEAAALAADPTADIAVGEAVGEPNGSLLRSTRLDAGEMETAFRHLVIRADRAFESGRPEVARAALARAELAARTPVLAARQKDFLAALTRRFAELGDAETVVRIDKELADPEPVSGVRADLVLAHALAGNLAAAADVAAPLRGEAGMHGGIAVVRGLVRAEEVDLARALAEQLEGDIAAVEPPPARARFLAELGRAYREVEAAERK